MSKINNILIVLGEDHGQWAVGSYGNREIRTPTLDYLAYSGIQMDNAFTPTPVCSPGRACLLTGRLASQHGIHDYLISASPEIHHYPWLKDEITLSELLANAGYQTGLSGKWHLGDDENPHPAFHFWFSLTGDYPIEHGGPHRYSDQGQIKTITGYKTQIITDQAIRFLRDRDTYKPFFLFVSYTAAHSPWNRHPERIVDQYRSCTFNDIPSDDAYPFGIQNLESTLPTRLNPHEAKAQYYAAITQIDEGTGRLLDELEAQGIRDSTLVVYTSDHGLNCGQHGIWGKGNGTLPLNMVEESIRIPLIFNQPGQLYGHQHRLEFVDHLDVFQTLVNYAGLTLPSRFEGSYPGRSFLPLLDNSEPIPDWKECQFGEYGNLRMVRTRTHKLIRRYPDGPAELFDLIRDPRETVNLFHDPEHKPLIDELTHRIENYFAKYEDPEKSGLRGNSLPRYNNSAAWM